MDALQCRAFRMPVNAKKLRRSDEDISSLQKIINAISCELLLKGETVKVVDISRRVHPQEEFIIDIVVKGVKGRRVALRAEFIRHHIQESLSTVAVLDASVEDSLLDRDGDSATTAKSSALIFGEGVTSAAFSVLAEMRGVFVALRTLHDDDHKVSSAIVVGQPEAVKDLCFDLGTIPRID